MKILYRYFPLILLLLSALLPLKATAIDVKRILLIDSHSAADLWTGDIRNGLQARLNEAGLKINYENYELGVRYRPGVVPARSDIAALQTKLDSTHYDLVVTSNNPATDLFLDGTLKLPTGTPLLVSAYYGSLAGRIPAHAEVTGLEIPQTLRESVELSTRLFPGNRQFVAIIEATPEPMSFPQVKSVLPADIAANCRILDGAGHTTAELLEEVSKLPENTTIFFHSWSSSKEALPENSYTLLPQLRKQFRGPIFGKFDSYIRYGAAGGWTVSGTEQGELAGALAGRILSGERPSAIPVQTGRARLVLNYPELERFGVRSIPPEAKLLNAPQDFLIRHRNWLALSATAIIAILAAGLGALLYRRLAESKARLLFSQLPVRLAVADRNGRILYSHLGAPDGIERPAFSAFDDIPESIRPLFAEAVEKAFRTGEEQEFTYELDNQHRHVRFRRLPERNAFRTQAVMWFSTDATELYNANAAIVQAAERFRLTLESIGDGVIATDREERITLINPVAARLIGYPPEEITGKSLADVFRIVSYLDDSPVPSPLRKALNTGTIVELANHTDLIAADGTRRHIADSAAPIRDANGTITGGVLVFRDVTEEYEKRDQLKLNSIVLKNASKIAGFTHFRCDETGKLTVSAEESCSEFWPKRNGVNIPADEWVSPEDLPEFTAEWGKLLAGEISELSLTYRAGTEREFFEMRVEKSVDEITGREEFFGVIQDITHARRNEQEYRDGLRLLETITNHLPGFIFVKNVDDNFRYIMCNRGFEELTGVSRDEIVGNFDNAIFKLDDEAARKFRSDDMRLVESGGTFDLPETLTNANGQQLVVRTIKNVLTRSDGTRLLIGMGVDVSRQHELEQQQKQTIETLNDFARSERIINESLTRITLENDFDKAVTDMLRIIGENAGADRCYLFRYRDETLHRSDNDYEWVRDGIAPEIHNLQNVDMTALPNWGLKLAAGEEIIIHDIAKPPADLGPEAAFLSVQNIRSLLVTGIRVGGRLYGYVGMDFVREHRKFTDCDIHTVHSIANLFLLARERRNQMNRIADGVSLQRQIVDNLSIPLAIIDPGFNIVTANPSSASECGECLESLPGRKCYEVICRCPSPPEWCPMVETLADQHPHSVEHDIHGRKEIITTQPLFDRTGKLMYILKSAVDITELTLQKQELQKAVEQALAADRAKSYFLATVSHELRTPLNAIIGFSELLEGGGVEPEEQKEYLHSINFAGGALLNLINDVLDLSRLEADQIQLSPKPTDAAHLVTEIAAIFKLKAQEKNLALTVDVSRLRHQLWLDGLRLRQVLLNLLGNAVKFTPSGSVSLNAEFLPDAVGETGKLLLRVSDTGIGISPESARKIFEPFVQDHSTRGTRIYEGSGLGLAISQRLVDRMGGSIHLDSTPGKGSTFSVELDGIRYEQTTQMAPGEETLPSETPKSDIRVLLVDDVPMNLKVLEAMLRKQGAESVSVASGAEALAQLAKDSDFDLVLTDLWMPEMSGAELAEKLAAAPGFARIPVAAVTADAQILTDTPGVFRGVLLKPITPDSLRKVLADLLNSDNKVPLC